MSKIKTIYISCLILLGAVSQSAHCQETNRFEISKQLEIFNALVKEVEMFYVDSVEVDKMVRRGIDAMLKGFDPYTQYIPEENMDALKYITTGEYAGIGALIEQRKRGVVIAEPYEGMPAQLAGLKTGDIIISIDTTDVTTMTSNEVSELLKGVPNSKVTVTVRRPLEPKPKKFELIRKQIVITQVPYYGVRGDGTGYIYLSGFTDKSASEVKAAFEDLKQNHRIKSLILDLRDNGGGILDAAVQIVNMFVPKGKEVVSTRGKIPQRDLIYRTSLEPVDTVIPIAVLINGNSASAAEIVCGALQDLDRAVLVGERSYGKGLVQSTRDLPYNGKVKITISKYYIPSGRCIQQIDYAHRNADGSASAIPDSLTHLFHTANGRPVRDGGGIRPDFEIEEKDLPTMLYYLVNDDILLDYVNEWAAKHKSIPAPEQFVYSDKDYEGFKEYISERNFTYDRQSEKYLKELEQVAEYEGYIDGDTTLFADLKTRLTPDLTHDLDRHKDEIKRLIATKISQRYYYQKGEIIESLKNDNTLTKALEVLTDSELYRKTLGRPEE